MTGTTPLNSATNPNNFYSTQWILGRFSTLLVEPDTNNEIWDKNDIQQAYIARATGDGPDILSPLEYGSGSTYGGAGYSVNDPPIQHSRYDLAGTSISEMYNQLRTYIDHTSGHSRTVALGPLSPPFNDDWWSRMMYRHQGSDFFSRPLTAEGVARLSPIFLNSCTQFIVEYAGDFVAQDNAPTSPTHGYVTGVYWDDTTRTVNPSGYDGEIDYVLDANGIAKTRWYGFPRDTDGDNLILGWISGRNNNQMLDVVPLRDVWRTAPGMATSNGAPFERTQDPNTMYIYLPPVADYVSGMGYQDTYLCAWGTNPTMDRRPQMIRITLAIDDPNGRIGGAQTFEYVLKLPN